ncbi:MAG: YibE/F family protein [Acidimicrobiia bacterium]|nr:YibE/F family protein [Acidimicrobiia bacterium]
MDADDLPDEPDDRSHQPDDPADAATGGSGTDGEGEAVSDVAPAGHTHVGHGHGDDLLDIPETTNRWLWGIAAVLAFATVIGLVALWPSGESPPPLPGFATTFFDARVGAVDEVPCPGAPIVDDSGLQCAQLRVELLEGPDEGLSVGLDVFDAGSADFREGEVVVLSYDAAAEPEFRYRFSDRQRTSVLFWLAVLFALAVVLLGRLRGLAALVGLALSLAVLLVFTVPALLDDSDAVLVAVVTAAAISFLAIYLAHGFTAMSTVALLGTLGALALTIALSVIFVSLANLTGLGGDEVTFLRQVSGTIDLRGLLLAGIIIGALGALDDMTVTQASAVFELRAANDRMSTAELYAAGIRIGRDHVASTVNTLVLAYAGAAMPLFLLFAATDQPLAAIANGEIVATEIVRTLVGSIGLVAAVPLTTWLAALTARHATPSADAVA